MMIAASDAIAVAGIILGCIGAFIGGAALVISNRQQRR